MPRPLYSIGSDLIALNDLLDSTGGEITPDAEAELTAWMDSLAQEESAKLDSYVNLIRQNEMEASACQAEAEEWAKRAQVRDNRVKWLKARLKLHLEATGRTKVQTETGRVVAIQANGGVTPLILVEGIEPRQLPPEFVHVTVAADPVKIRAALNAGLELAFAHYGERGSHLRIR
jgi:hypothetical protein